MALSNCFANEKPSIAITKARMPGWFDLYDWPVEVGATDDKLQKMQGVRLIEQEVAKLREKGIDKIVVGGFSQGGAVALLAAYHQEANMSGVKLAGCASLSGWLTLTEELQVPEESKEIPLFWAHGEYDDKVLFGHLAYGIEKLKKQGVKTVESKQYPIGHE